MADNVNQNVAILSLMAKLEDNSKEISAQAKKMIGKVEKTAGTIEFGADTKEIQNAIERINKLIDGKLKGIDLTKQFGSILKVFSNAESSAEDYLNILDKVHNELFSISKLPKNSLDLMGNFSPKQVEQVLKVYDKLINKQEQYSKKLEESRKKAQSIEAKSLISLKRDYKGNTSYDTASSDTSIESLAKQIGLENNATAKRDIKEYSQLLSIFNLLQDRKKELSKIDTVKAAEEEVQINKSLLNIINEIATKEKRLSTAFGAKDLLSSSLEGFDTGEINRLILRSVDEYSTRASKVVKDSIKQLQNELDQTILDYSQKNVDKMVSAQEKASEKVKARIDKRSSSITSSTKGSQDGGIENIGDVAQNASENVQKLDNVLENIGDDSGSNELDLWAKSAENLKEEFADVIKYAVDAETALKEVERLAEEATKKGLNDKEQRDLIGYARRFDEINQDDEAYMSDDALDWIENYEDKYKITANNVAKMTQAQLVEIEKLKVAQKEVAEQPISDSSSTSVLEKQTEKVTESIEELVKAEKEVGKQSDNFTKPSQEILELVQRVETLESSLSDMQKQLSSLNGEAFEKMKNDISDVKKELGDAVTKIKELNANSGVSLEDKLSKESLTVESATAMAQYYSDLATIDDKTGIYTEWDNVVETVTAYHEKIKETNAYLQKGNDLIEERAILLKNGKQVGEEYVMSDANGKVDIGNGIKEYKADSVLHTHAFSEEVNNLRFSDADIQELVDGTVQKALLLCGDEIATLDMSNVAKSDFEPLKNDILGAYTAVFARFGAEVKDGKLVGIDTLPHEIQNQATDIINNLLRGIMQNYGGDLVFDKINNNELIANDDARLPKIDSSEIDMVQKYIGAITSDKPVENIIALQKQFGVLKSEFQEIQQEAKETAIALSDVNQSSALSGNQTEVLSGTDNSELARIKNEIVSRETEILELQKRQAEIAETKNNAFKESNGDLAEYTRLTGELFVQEKEISEQIERLNVEILHFRADHIQEQLEQANTTTEVWFRRIHDIREILQDTGAFFAKDLRVSETYFNPDSITDRLISADIDTSRFLTVDAEAKRWNELFNICDKLKQEALELGIVLDVLEDKERNVFYGNTKWIADAAKQLGYAGVRIKDVKDVGGFGDDYDLTGDIIQAFDNSLITNIQDVTDVYRGLSTEFSKIEAATQVIFNAPKFIPFDLEGIEKFSEAEQTVWKKMLEIRDVFSDLSHWNIDNNLEAEFVPLLEQLRLGEISLEEFYRGYDEIIKRYNDSLNSLTNDDKIKILEDRLEITNKNFRKGLIDVSFVDEIESELNELKKVNQTPLSLVEESYGQLAMFEGVEEQQKEVKTAIEKTNDAIEGQIDLFEYLSKQEAKSSEPIKDTFEADTSTAFTGQHTSDIKAETNAIEENTQALKENAQVQKKQSETKEDISDTRIHDVNKAWTAAIRENKVFDENKTRLAIKNYEELIGKLDEYYALLAKEHKGQLTSDETDSLNKFRDQINKASKSIDEFKGKEKDLKDVVKKFNTRISEFDKDSGLIGRNERNDIFESLSQDDIISTKTDKYETKLKDLENIILEIRKLVPIDVNSEEDRKELNRLNAEFDKLANNLSSNEYNPAKQIDIDALSGKIFDTLHKNTAAPKEIRMQLEGLIAKLKEFGLSEADIQKVREEFVKLNSQMKATGKTGDSLGTKIKKKFKDVAAYFSTYVSIQDAIQVIRQGFETIKEYDKALTEMNKVSDESISTLKEYQQESFKTADAIGTTASALQNSVADWQRLGEAFEEAQQSAQDANILFNVSEFESIDEATESLVSMSQAYKELEKGEIIDVVNNLGNNFAISTDGLATALQNSASALKTAQNDFFEAAALTTAANTVVQDPDKVGAGLRTIALRLTGTEAAREELAALGEDVDDFVVTTTSKLDQKIKDLTKTQGNFGVSLLDMNGNYRSTYEVLLDIAKVWDKIAQEDLATGENRQNALLEMMANTSLYVQKCA